MGLNANHGDRIIVETWADTPKGQGNKQKTGNNKKAEQEVHSLFQEQDFVKLKWESELFKEVSVIVRLVSWYGACKRVTSFSLFYQVNVESRLAYMHC